MLILFLKLQHYTLTFLHLVLFSLHIFNFPTFPSFPFLSFFFTPFSIHFYLFLLLFLFSFIHFYLLYFSLCISILLSYFSYILSCCAQTHPTIFVISYYHFDCKHCIMPSYCAVLYLAIINFIGSSFKSLCNSALLCHYCAIVDHLLICLLL